ncbi:hypothetical protein [Flavobacterium sp.]|uniref:hypothetical protein n=1 Tax=Flavobacterium sp. TaxID=239 RepID=UPI0025E148D8|nr:hypothetical protein [Flavobacterium sp.]
MKHVHFNSSIECASAIIISRKITPSSYMVINKIGKCRTFKCSRNSEAVILKELDPKEAYHNIHSCLDLNDKLESEDIFLAINCKKSPKIELINHTGRHKAQACNTSEYTFAKVSKQFPNIADLNPQKNIVLLENIELLEE